MFRIWADTVQTLGRQSWLPSDDDDESQSRRLETVRAFLEFLKNIQTRRRIFSSKFESWDRQEIKACFSFLCQAIFLIQARQKSSLRHFWQSRPEKIWFLIQTIFVFLRPILNDLIPILYFLVISVFGQIKNINKARFIFHKFLQTVAQVLKCSCFYLQFMQYNLKVRLQAHTLKSQIVHQSPEITF